MGFILDRQGLREEVLAGLGDPAVVNGSTNAVNMRLIERDEALAFGEARINAATVRIEAPISAGVRRGDRITFDADPRTFIVNSTPVVVRSGVHSLSCEVAS